MMLRTILTLFFVASTVTAQSKVKGLWVVRDILKSKTETDKMLAFVREAGISDLFLQVRGRGDAYYNSRLVTRAEDLDTGWDPLQYVSEHLDGSSVRLHAWLNVYYLWSADKPPKDSSHLYFRRPEWASVSRSGIAMTTEKMENLKKQGTEGIFLSPAEDDFRSYFGLVVMELVRNYRIDGVHLDYIRLPGKDYDFSVAMRSKFRLAYNSEPPSSENEVLQGFWRLVQKDQVTSLVSTIYDSIKSVRQSVQLSAAVWADLNYADNHVFQDWPVWIAQNKVDFVVMMNYAADDTVFERRIVEAASRSGSLNKIVTGVSLYNQDLESAKRKILIAKKYAPLGISFFSYETVRTDAKIRKLVLDSNK